MRTQWAVVIAHCVLVQAAAYLLRPAASYRAVELGASVVDVSIVGATYALLPIILGPWVGVVVDRRGTRLVALIGSVLVLCSALLLALGADRVWMLAFATAILGLGHLCCVGSQQVVVSQARPELLDRRLSYYTFAASVAQTAAPLVLAAFGGGALLPDTKGMFWTAVVMSVLLLGATAGMDGPRTRDMPTQENDEGAPTIRSLIPAMISGAIVLSTVDLLTIYLPVLGAQRGLDSAWVGLLLAARAGASMLSRLSYGTMVRRVGRNNLLFWSMALATACMIGLTIPMNLAVLFFLVVLIGWALGVGQPLTMAWVITLTPVGVRGRILSLRLVANRVSQVVVPVVAGAVSVGAGVSGVMATGAAATGVTAALARHEREVDDDS